jgi:hypothetical protein
MDPRQFLPAKVMSRITRLHADEAAGMDEVGEAEMRGAGAQYGFGQEQEDHPGEKDGTLPEVAVGRASRPPPNAGG